MPGAEIRPAEVRDARALSPLLAELGYPAPAEQLGSRIERLADNPGAIVLVATIERDIVGIATAHVFATIHAEAPAAWITALVVSGASRRRGVGRALVRALERWAHERGAVRISVNSGTQRADAHAFYESSGYAASGKRFTRSL